MAFSTSLRGLASRFRSLASSQASAVSSLVLKPSTRLASTAAAEAASSSTAAATTVTAYARSLSAFHWAMATGFMGCFATVQLAMASPMPKKAEYMHLHKSIGMLMLGAAVPRILLRLATKAPPLPEGPAVEHFAAHASHAAMYFFMVFMPVSGFAMGYYGPKGVPFFSVTIPPKENRTKEDKAFAGQAFKAHKLVGQAFEYLTPVHVGAVGVHMLKGQNILKRVNPFAAAQVAK